MSTPNINLSTLLSTHQQSEATALTGAFGTLSYSELNHMVGAARAHLQELGITRGDRVALSLPNIIAMPVYYYAVLSLGAICVPLNPLLSLREVRYHLQDSGAELLLSWDGARLVTDGAQLDGITLELIDASAELPALSEPWEPTLLHESTPAVILYTSGTTGEPKGATLTHRNLMANATTVARVFEYTEQDVFFGGLPLFHSFGQTVSMNAVFAAGASIALLPRFSPDGAAQLCVAAQVTIIAAVPSMYTAMAAYLESRSPHELRGKIRYGISGGSALPASVHADFERILDCPILEGYGLSETSPVVSFNQPRFEPVIGSVGRVIDGVQVQVRGENSQLLPAGEPGQLWVAGPGVMAGYWEQEEATRAVFDGQWLATGDVARLDQNGNIFIVDRIKDMILRNGYSIYPREIEDVLYTHPAVSMVAVVGRKDERVGEEIFALVVPRQELSLAEQDQLVQELDALSRRELAAYKYPRHFSVVDSLPLGPTGKILKRQL